jgi:hypothetical protein
MLKPLGRSRGRRLCRSAPGGAAFGRGGQEACEPGDRGRLLAGPLEDAANHWAVESASLQLTAYEAGEAAGPDGRSSSPSAASPGVRPMSKRTSTPLSPRSGRSPARGGPAAPKASRTQPRPQKVGKGAVRRAHLCDPAVLVRP